MAKTGPKKGTQTWQLESPTFVYRKPIVVGVRWKVRRRNKYNNKISQITLDAPVTGAKGRGIKEAKREIEEIVTQERLEPKDANKGIKNSSTNLNIKVGEALDKWLTTLEPPSLETKADYKRDVQLYKKLLNPERNLTELTFTDISELFFVTWKDRSGRTKIKHRGMLVRFFRWAKKVGFREDNPAEEIEIQTSWREQASIGAEIGQALTIEEARQLLIACKEPYSLNSRPDLKDSQDYECTPPSSLWWAVFISLRTGLRWSNVVGSNTKTAKKNRKPGLLWSHIDLKEWEINIPRELMKNRHPFRAPMHNELIGALESKLDSLPTKPKPNEKVITEGVDLRKSFSSALKRANLAIKAKHAKDCYFLGELADKLNPHPFRLHDLRHSFCSWVDSTTSFTIAKILKGDSMRGTDFRYMRHKKMSELREEINKLPNLVEIVQS